MPSLYPFQEQAVNDLKFGKSIAILPTGAGKTAVMFRWLGSTGRNKILVVTTPSKAKSGDMQNEAVLWNGQKWVDNLEEFVVISWHKLRKWQQEHSKDLMINGYKWAMAFDEVAKAKGYSSGMGRAFQLLTKNSPCWTGYTATPGDKWIDLMPYMVATGKFRNKTDFMNRHAILQHFRGFPEIKKYIDTDKLTSIWNSITTRPNTEQLTRELPSETHKVIEFKAPKDYKKIVKDRIDPKTGDYIESTMGLVHMCRQICFTKEKQSWLSEFIEGLGTNCVFFCNYIEEEETLCQIAAKSLPKGSRVWRIDGKHHEIPTADTIGKYDIVVAHYASGGEALNLQFMHYWCSVSPNYSLSTSIQARGRIKRIGQKNPMFFYYCKTMNTIEQDIYKCLKQKQDFSEKTWLADNGLADV